MEHTKAEDIQWKPAPEDHFTGKVWFGPLSHATEEGLNALAVQFEPGARTDWHTHPDGQVLYVVNDKCTIGLFSRAPCQCRSPGEA